MTLYALAAVDDIDIALRTVSNDTNYKGKSGPVSAIDTRRKVFHKILKLSLPFFNI